MEKCTGFCEKLYRLAVFQAESGTNKAIHITLISANGYKSSKYSGIIQTVILGDELFE